MNTNQRKQVSALSLREAMRSACITLLLVASFPAASDSVQLQTFRAQLRQAEHVGMTDMADSLRLMIKTLEEEEAESAATVDTGSATAVRPSYFADVGRAELETCTYANDAQFDTLCTAAMLRYNDYLAAAGSGAAQDVQAEAWRRHEATAKVYVQGIGLDGHGVRENAPRLSSDSSHGSSVQGRAEQVETPADSERGSSQPCPGGSPCVTPQ